MGYSIVSVILASALILAIASISVGQEQQQAAVPPQQPAHPLPAEFLDHKLSEHHGLDKTQSAPMAGTENEKVTSLNASQVHEEQVKLDAEKAEKEKTNKVRSIDEGTTTPEDATGHSWIFSENATDRRRTIGLQSRVSMFTTERACGFAIETDRGVLYPWMATLSCNNVQCSGTLVSHNLILTSASCIMACGTDQVRVRLGDARLMGCGAKPLEIMASQAVVNPKFTSTRNAQFDVGLVQLLTPLDFNVNPFVYPICLVGVETDDPSIDCEVVMGNVQQKVLSSPVNCYQPGNQLCASNGLTGVTGCVRLHQCFPISNQPSVPVICRRRTSPNPRYYLWGVTTSSHAAASCTSGVARISDGFSFISQGLGFET